MSEEERRFAAEMTVHLTAARDKFPDFYARAKPAEILLFDSLIMSRVLLAAGLAVSGHYLNGDARHTFERDNIAVEQMFTGLREKVRDSAAFKALPEATRSLIEREICEVQAET